MSGAKITCGYLPLVDSAPLIIAKELDFAAREGVDLRLMRQPSWSALRDRLAFGQIELAHMLSPMPIASTLGLSGVATKIDALMVMSVNGTVIGVSSDLAKQMRQAGWHETFQSPEATSKAIFETDMKIRIGVPFPFSMHRMLLEYWLKKAPTFSADRFEIVTVPPPDMAKAVEEGRLDMFCVGEPWGSVAVQHCDALLILPGSKVWGFAPEKVLGARHDWVAENADICKATIRAVYRAGQWLEQSQNKPLAAEILAASQHLDLPEEAIDPALTHQIKTHRTNSPAHVEQFLNFHDRAANFPWRSQACWIADRLAEWHSIDKHKARDIARTCFRSDLFRNAVETIGADLPSASEKLEGAMAGPTPVASRRGQMILGPDRFFDGEVFDFHRSNLLNK